MALNILFTCSGRRNYLINYFKAALNGQGKVFTADASKLAPSMVDADKAIVVPSIYSNQYINTLKEIVKTHNISAIISLNDLELPILSPYKTDFQSLNCELLISNSEVINIGFDKLETVKYLSKNGLKTPKTFTRLNDAILAIENKTLSFPLVVKPRWGSASIGIDFPEDLEELKLSFALQHKKLQKSILKEASANNLEDAILIQEKIVGKEYGMDILNDFTGNYLGSFSREKIKMRSGETDIAISVINKNLEVIGRTIGSTLKHVGNLDCDILEDEASNLYVLELNPRFGGGYPFSHEAGMNTAKLYIDLLNGKNTFKEHNKYRDNITFSKCDRLLKIK
ncbi:MAG: ATP-dependent carboxylate-amine ligase [Bacteroidetes bacterium MedPE-SWsnd-G2]|nr:MAG: ATP-dependent carboxylate-amine ligase [Bacteroidetes bacterium MedPE-SWsnd-G2]